MRRSHPPSQLQLLIIQVHSNNNGTSKSGTNNSTYTNHTATDDHHIFIVNHLTARNGMKSHTHRLNQGTITRRNITCRNNFSPGQYSIFTHHAIPLHSQCFIMFAGIDTTIAARGTFTTISIWIQSHIHSFFKTCRNIRTYFFNYRTYFMPWHYRQFYHRITPQEGVQIGTAETHIFNSH